MTVIALKRKKYTITKKTDLPKTILKNQRCILCGTYGCVPYYLTPLQYEGTFTGDNLLPLCIHHSTFHILSLYPRFPVIREWLIEHERIDLVLAFEQNSKRSHA